MVKDIIIVGHHEEPSREEIFSKGIHEFAAKLNLEALVESSLEKWMESCAHEHIALHREYISISLSTPGLENYSVEDYVGEASKKSKEEYLKEAQLAKEMYSELVKINEERGFVKMALKRHRNKDSRWDYRVLAQVPEGSIFRFGSPIIFDNNIKNASGKILYVISRAPCMNHACDLLFKSLIPCHAGSFELKYDQLESISTPRPGSKMVEFMDPATRETKNSENFILAAVMGYFAGIKSYSIPEKLLK